MNHAEEQTASSLDNQTMTVVTGRAFYTPQNR
uniref:Uncharacterized protein n=1 Tax=Arundo donax TaxID=35708 RepID=A0A0A9HBV2_ARUDO